MLRTSTFLGWGKALQQQDTTQAKLDELHAELEDFFVNNERLDELETFLGRFNPIRVMRMEAMEIRHSAILAWLLDPVESHGLEDRFLRAFLAAALKGSGAGEKPTSLDIVQEDLRDAIIRREWRNIDIFVYLERRSWAIIIENKFHSKQHSDQLRRYREVVKNTYGKKANGEAVRIRGIFLTLEEEDPNDERYVSIRYADVCEILARLAGEIGGRLSPEVVAFLGHYLDSLRETLGMSDEEKKMEALARDLYRSHGRVLDFIMTHGATSDFDLAVEEAFRSETDADGLSVGDIFEVAGRKFEFHKKNNSLVSFIPLKWVGALGEDPKWDGCKNWWAEYPLICWQQLFGDKKGSGGMLRLIAEVGPIADHSLRKALIEAIQEEAKASGVKGVKFQRTAADEGKRYSKFLDNRSYSRKIADVQDGEELARELASQVEHAVGVFDAVERALRQVSQLRSAKKAS